jgi:hypothetical protein
MGEERRIESFEQCRSSLAILEGNGRDPPPAEITLKSPLGTDDLPAFGQAVNAGEAAQTARPSYVTEANR